MIEGGDDAAILQNDSSSELPFCCKCGHSAILPSRPHALTHPFLPRARSSTARATEQQVQGSRSWAIAATSTKVGAPPATRTRLGSSRVTSTPRTIMNNLS